MQDSVRDLASSSAANPTGKRNGNYKHGRFTNEAIAMRRRIRAWVRQMEEIAETVE